MNKDSKNENVEEKEENKNMGFFKKVWYSIDKIEKYSDLAAEGFPKAIKYLVQLVLILAIIVASVTLYETKKQIDEISKFIQNEIPDFTYSNNELKMESNEVIINEQNNFGKVIIDLNEKSEEEINNYINEIKDENGIIMLKNKLILRENGINGNISYSYEELLQQLGITEFNKQDLINYLSSNKIMPTYLSLFAVLVIYSFAIYLINTLLNVLAISIFGYLATLIVRMKIKYRAIFNMAVYSITLVTILDMVYIFVNQIFNIKINYFDVMYILVSCIYMIAAIFMLKSDFTKKQEQVTKIIEVENQVKQEMQEKENEKEKENKEDKESEKEKKDNKKDNEKEKNDGQEPEGSNA